MTKIGIFNPYLETRGGGEKMCLAAASILSKSGYDVSMITHGKVSLEDLGKYLEVDLSRVSLVVVKPSFTTKVVNRLPLPGGLKHFFSDQAVFRIIKKGNFDVLINNCFQSNLPNPAKHGIYLCMFPQKIKAKNGYSFIKAAYWAVIRMLYRLTMHPVHKHPVYTYDQILAISQYTKGYVQKYWDVDSTILYPICDNMLASSPTEKEKMIIHVGRFFERLDANHHKKQDFLLESFKKMESLIKQGWQLHFVGSVAEDVGALKYILHLLKEARGYPIYFHFNSPRDELKKLYNSASIYWHATGYGGNAEKYPESQEHFGITTIEAMTAGCIPVVFNSAGQKESVIQGENGFLWNNAKELDELTNKVASMSPIEQKALRAKAQESAIKFGRQNFDKHVLEILGQVVNTPEAK